MISTIWRIVLTGCVVLTPTTFCMAQLVGYADVIVEFFDSGNGTLPGGGPQGGVFPPPASTPTAVSLDVVLGDDGPIVDYLSLPLGSFVTVGFTNENIIDGPGDDIFVTEVGEAGDEGEVFVSEFFSTDPSDFVSIGIVTANTTTSFDLADFGIAGPIFAVKVVGLDLGGSPGAPGFDLANVRAINAVTLPGDLDFDGDADGADFLEWQRTDGTAGGLADWQANYGMSSGPTLASTVVPEPSSTLSMLGLAVTSVLSRRGR